MADAEHDFKPTAEFFLDDQKHRVKSGSTPPEPGFADGSEACRVLVDDLMRNTSYRPNHNALPLTFREGFHSLERMDTSLQFHAEKKALAICLEAGTPNPTISVNLRVCKDCH